MIHEKYEFTDFLKEKYTINIDIGREGTILRINRVSPDGYSWTEIYFYKVANNQIDWTNNIALDPETIYPDIRKYCEKIFKLHHFS